MAKQSVNTRGIGLELQRLRKLRKLSCREVGAALGASASTISRIETGRREPPSEEVASILTILGIKGVERAHLVDLARRQDEVGLIESTLSTEQIRHYRNFELRATRITDFAPMLIPGMAQTAEYAHAVVSALWLDNSESEIESVVGDRMSRYAIMTRRQPPQLHWILTELGLRQPVGGAKQMGAQLRRLVELANRPNITVNIVPTKIATHAGLMGQFVVMDFRSEPTVVHVEDMTTGLFIDDEHRVASYKLVVKRLTEVALDAAASVRLMESIAGDFERG